MRSGPLNGRLALLGSISTLALSAALPASAAEDPSVADVGEIVVTASRRETTIQGSPINIAAVGAPQIAEQGFQNLQDIAKWVPGVFIVDQGPRQSSDIVVRGLNASPTSSNDGSNDGGDKVATYLGDIPTYISLRLKDMDRVEFLLGPQGTLYGAGTLGGAIRYIPTRPLLGAYAGVVRGDVYGYSQGSGVSRDFGGTLNVPLGSTFAMRGSLDRVKDRGFIDQPYVVNSIGGTNPDVLDSNNVHPVEDTNWEETISGRLGLRWKPIDRIDANLTYYYQNQEVGGRQVSAVGVDTFPVPVGKWENIKRVLEPNRLKNEILALEVTGDLGFATLTSATGLAHFEAKGNRDQTDLLIGLEYSYEAFPNFTAITEERDKMNTITQEARLVSKDTGPFNWIVGGFYRKRERSGTSREFTPGFSEFLFDNGIGGAVRPDSLEYYSVGIDELKEKAGFGELSFKITPKWQITGGARYYSYTYDVRQATDFPLANTAYGGSPPDEIVMDFTTDGQKDKGWLFKFNTQYRFTDLVNAYFTYSEGYRIGSSNGIEACSTSGGIQNVCGSPSELAYFPDKTRNYELGFHSQWFDRRLTLNGDVYLIDWVDPQVDSATQVGLQPIIVNGAKARSKGFEVSFLARPTSALSVRGSFSYNNAKFVERAPNLIRQINPPGFQNTLTFVDGEKGDRLPGSPKRQGNLFADYAVPVNGGEMTLHFGWGMAHVGSVLTRTGGRGGGYVLPPYTTHNPQIRLQGDSWTASVYVDNLTDKFAQTGAQTTKAYNQVVSDINGDPVYARTFFINVLAPRTVGIRFEKKFGG